MQDQDDPLLDDRGRREDAHGLLVQRLRGVLAAHQNVREVRMFGGLSFMVDERMAVAAGRDGDLLVRADPARYDDLLQRGGEAAHMGTDRPMGRGWLTVRHERIREDEELAYWVDVGINSQGAVSETGQQTLVPAHPTRGRSPRQR